MIRTSVSMQASAQLAALAQNVNTALAASRNAATGTEQASFLEQLQELSASVEAKATAAAKEPGDMTMEEYQAYIVAKIESFPFSPTRPNDEEIIKVSDKCWERMKSDPEYEEKMMSQIREGRMYPDPFYGMGSPGTYWVLEFDGGEGCYSHAWSKNFGGSPAGARKRFEDAADDAVTVRTKKRKLQRELDERYYEKQRTIKEMNEQIAVMRSAQRKNALLGDDLLPEMPIMGVPAEFLLAGLGMGL